MSWPPPWIITLGTEKYLWERKNTDRRFLPNGAEKLPKRQKITLCPEKLRKRRKITLGTVKYPSPGFAGGGAEKSQGGQKNHFFSPK